MNYHASAVLMLLPPRDFLRRMKQHRQSITMPMSNTPPTAAITAIIQFLSGSSRVPTIGTAGTERGEY